MKYLIKTLLLTLFALSANAVTMNKEIRRNFVAGEVVELHISNNFGDIEIGQVDSDSIYFESLIKIDAKTGLKAEEALDMIGVDYIISTNKIQINVCYDGNTTINSLLNGMDMNVACKLHLPKGIKLSIVQANGTVIMTNYNGILDVDINNGNLTANRISGGYMNIKQKDGRFKVESIDTLVADIQDVNMSVQEMGNVRIDSRNSDIQISSIETLDINSYRGRCSIAYINEIRGESFSTNYEIEDLNHIFDMKTRMGEMNIFRIRKMFTSINIESSFTKLGLSFESGGGYQLEINHNKLAKLDLPFIVTDETKTDDNRTLKRKFVGDKAYSSKVYLHISSGNMFIQ